MKVLFHFDHEYEPAACCMYRMIYPSDDCFGCMSTLGNKIIMDSLNMQMFHDTPVPSIIYTVISILHCEGPYV